MRTTLGDIRNSRIPYAIGLCPDDSRITAYVNEAQQRLLTKGLFWGTFGRFRICSDSGCITLPAQIATIESVAVCGQPVPTRDAWYEFLENGFGPRNGSGNCSSGNCGRIGDGIPEALHRGNFCTFKDIQPSGKKLNFVCDLSSDVGKQVLALGYDDNGNWIRTDQGGTIKDGELIAFAQSGGTNSVNNFSSVNDIQLPDDMDGQSWLYEYDTSALTRRLIGKYEYFETRPNYARYFFPSICSRSCSDSDCCQTPVDIIGKLEFIPVKQDTDYLIIGNIPAMKEMIVAVSQAEKEPDSIARNKIIQSGYVNAVAELDAELRHYVGDGVTRGITIVGSSIYTNNPVETLL